MAGECVIQKQERSASSKLRAWILFWPFKVKDVINAILTCFPVFSSVPVEEQEEFKQLTDDIQELQQSLNQEFRQKTVSVMKHLEIFLKTTFP